MIEFGCVDCVEPYLRDVKPANVDFGTVNARMIYIYDGISLCHWHLKQRKETLVREMDRVKASHKAFVEAHHSQIVYYNEPQKTRRRWRGGKRMR